jgi:hypothetical protein
MECFCTPKQTATMSPLARSVVTLSYLPASGNEKAIDLVSAEREPILVSGGVASGRGRISGVRGQLLRNKLVTLLLLCSVLFLFFRLFRALMLSTGKNISTFFDIVDNTYCKKLVELLSSVGSMENKSNFIFIHIYI